MQGASIHARIVPLRAARGGHEWERWRELAAGAPPFLTPEFFALSAPLVEGEPLVAEAWDHDALVGVLPLLRSGRDLLALRTPHTPEYDYLGSTEGLDAVWRALRREPGWDVLFLEQVPAGSLLATHLVENAGGFPAVVKAGERHRSFSLRGFDERLDHHFHANLRRCERKAGELELERLVHPSRAAFQEALAIEAQVWKAAAGSSIDHHRQVEHLYRAMLRLFGPRGQAAINVLRARGKPIAILYTVEDSDTLYALKIGYDKAATALSPGHLVVWKVAADAERRGLEQLNFVGRDDEWKRRWTTEAEDQVSVTLYGRTPRGLLLYAAREQIKPRLPEGHRDLHTPLRHGCQRLDTIGTHTMAERVRGRLHMGLGIRSGIRRALSGTPTRPPFGEPSRFTVGSWVRVLDEPRLRATLDARSSLRGLPFNASLWPCCGKVYRVARQVRRIRDDDRRFKPISRTVLLEGVTCAGAGPEPAGCGRHCPMWFRDEWLEPAPAPRRSPPAPSVLPHAHVRSMEKIRASLDVFGQRDGLTFMPEMEHHAGRRVAVASLITLVHEHGRWTRPRAPVYLLEGLSCSGGSGHCDRGCPFLWHEDWLDIEPAAPPPPSDR